MPKPCESEIQEVCDTDSTTDSPMPACAEQQTESAKSETDDIDQSIIEIRNEFGNTVNEISNKYDLLLNLRDRRIEDLEHKLAENKQDTSKRRLLIVDNSDSTAAIVNRYLQGLPVEINHVPSHQAHNHTLLQDYDAIMLEAANDIEPNRDGLTLCRQLCEAGQGDRVIVMSSRPGDKVKHCVEQAGAAFLRKPFRREHLMQAIKKRLL